MNPPETPPATPSPRPAPIEISGWRKAVVWPFAALIRLWAMSLRFEIAPEEYAKITRRDVPIAMVLWHNRLFLSPQIYRRYRFPKPLTALISASGDGAWLAALYSQLGIRAARGSSSRLGREAATALVDALRAGHDIGITPDGPRGPCYELKPGVVIVARRTNTPLVVFGGEFTSAWRLKSWDRFYLPKPFSRVRIRCEVITPEQLEDRDRGLQLIKETLMRVSPDSVE